MIKGNGSRREISEARHDVELAKATLKARMEAATESSKRMVRRVADTAKPALYLVAGLGVLLLAAGIYRLARSPVRPSRWRRPGRSLIGEMVRAALVSAAGRLAARVVGEMPLPRLTEGSPTGAAE